jgi:hypothetical protein
MTEQTTRGTTQESAPKQWKVQEDCAKRRWCWDFMVELREAKPPGWQYTWDGETAGAPS